jgi:hypothetical protein
MEQLKQREEYSMSRRDLSLICSASLLLLVAVCAAAQTPPPSERRPPVSVAGHWVIEAKSWNGLSIPELSTSSRMATRSPATSNGPNESGGLEGSVNGQHIVFRTKTKHPLTFRGQVDGDTMTGN